MQLCFNYNFHNIRSKIKQTNNKMMMQGKMVVG